MKYFKLEIVRLSSFSACSYRDQSLKYNISYIPLYIYLIFNAILKQDPATCDEIPVNWRGARFTRLKRQLQSTTSQNAQESFQKINQIIKSSVLSIL